MPLTKSEFDRLREERDRAQAAMKDRPRIQTIGAINEGGGLDLRDSMLNPSEARSLYEMLRAWYGEDAQKPVPVSAVANELIEAAVSWRINCDNEHVGCSELPRVRRAVDAYLAEQTEKEKTQ